MMRAMAPRTSLALLLTMLGCAHGPSQSFLDSWKSYALGNSHVECDAAAGTITTWTRAIDPAGGTITGSIYMHAAHQFGNYAPAAIVYVADGDELQSSSRAGFVVTLDPDGYQDRGYLRKAPGDQIRTKSVRHALPGATVVRFAMRWRGPSVELRFDPKEDWVTLPLDFTPERLTLSCAAAEVFYHSVTVAAPPGNVDFDCRSPDGRFSSWTQKIDPKGGGVEGVVTFVGTPNESWAPLARIGLGHGDELSDALGVSISTEPRATTRIPLDARTPVGERGLLASVWDPRDPEETRRDLTRTPPGRPIPFALRWTATSLEVRLGPTGQWIALAKPTAKLDRLWLRCSNLEVKFTSVAVATAPR
jgi:hypothetical protein